MSSPVEYEGLRGYIGWRFTLTPQANAYGSPGYLLHQLQPSDASREWAQRKPDTSSSMSVEAKTAWIESGPDEWRESAWLTEWLKHGLIREVGTERHGRHG